MLSIQKQNDNVTLNLSDEQERIFRAKLPRFTGKPDHLPVGHVVVSPHIFRVAMHVVAGTVH